MSGTPNAHAEHLPGELMALVDRAGTRLSEVDVFAVATGPGSFTGLRIGIATMQGLAFAAGKPLVGVSGFDALARIAGVQPRVATWVDAWRGEVFAALYENGLDLLEPVLSRPQPLLESLRGRPTLFIGDGARMHADTIRSVMGDSARLAEPLAPALAGAIAIMAGETAVTAAHTADAIRPLYIRRMGAGLASDARPVE